MRSESTAYLSSCSGYINFSFGGKNIRFKGPYSLVKFDKVKEWDNADMIIANYAFTVAKNGEVKVLLLDDSSKACVLDKDGNMLIIQKYIRNNYLTMFEMWAKYSEHGFYGENK